MQKQNATPLSFNVTLSLLMFFCMNYAFSDDSNTQMENLNMANGLSCESIGGIYQFVGEINGSAQGDPLSNSLVGIMFGKPLLRGKPIATKLTHDGENNTLRVQVIGEGLEPVPDFTIPIQCVAGVVSYHYFEKGHGDGSSYEKESNFRFSKDMTGSLMIKKSYCIKSTNLMFFWSKRCGDATVRFAKAQ